MSLREGQVGGTFRANAKFDMSANTALSLTFTRTDGTKLVVNNPQVIAPAVPVTDPTLGPLNANEYFEYITQVGDIPEGSAGDWTVCGIYTDSTPKVFPSATATLTILEGCA